VKPHGALYHRASTDPAAAAAIVAAVARVDDGLRLVAAPAGPARAGAAIGLATMAEGFADRVYEADGRLRSRDLAGALHASPEAAAAQAVSIGRDGCVTAADGSTIDLRVETICVHSDTPGAAAIAAAVRSALAEAGIEVRAPGG
jgi:UPF0271 protein